MSNPLPPGDKGPADIIWGYGESGAMYLGEALMIHPILEQTYSDVNTSKAGNSPVDIVMTGATMRIECEFVQSTLEQMAAILGTEVIGGQIVPIKSFSGCAKYEDAKAVVIKPVCDNEPSTDPARWIHLYKCVIIPAIDFPFDVETQRTLPATIVVLRSQESGYTNKFGTIGMASGSVPI